MHLGLKPFSCAQCALAFSSPRHLKAHNDAVSGEASAFGAARRRVCLAPPTPAARRGRTALPLPPQVHLNLRPHPCGQCSAAFARPGDRKRHLASVHDNTRSHPCTQCDATFAEAAKLKSHVAAVHMLLKPHNCTLCEATFSRAGDLRKHAAAKHQ